MKLNPIGVRFDAETKAALERAAREDNRSLSSLIVLIVRGWLIGRGYLPYMEKPGTDQA